MRPLTLSSTGQQAVRQFRQRLEERFGSRLQGVKLFGSVARGEADAESDLDCLVLIQGLTWEEKRAVWDTATEINITCDTLVSPLVMTPEEFAALRDRERRIALDIDTEGIPI